MAHPVQMEPPRRDEFEETFRRLQLAPAKHAEALLAGLEVLQALHDQGILELLRGMLSGGSKKSSSTRRRTQTRFEECATC